MREFPVELIGQPECAECGGECCDPERIEYVVPASTSIRNASRVMARLGLPDALILGVRTNEWGERVVNIDCPRRGNCDPERRPERCRTFPLQCLEPDFPTEALRDTVLFCPLLRRLLRELDASGTG